jgi:hypothetical protein
MERYLEPEKRSVKPWAQLIKAANFALMACNEPAVHLNVNAILRGLLSNTFDVSARNVLLANPKISLWPGMRIEYAHWANSC